MAMAQTTANATQAAVRMERPRPIRHARTYIPAAVNDTVGNLPIGYENRKITSEIRRINSPLPGAPAGYNKKRCCFMAGRLSDWARFRKHRKLYFWVAHSIGHASGEIDGSAGISISDLRDRM